MKKTTVYLDPDVDLSLRRLAASQGITKAEAIRRALAQAVEQAATPRITAIGVVEGPGDVARRVDAYLEQAGFGRE